MIGEFAADMDADNATMEALKTYFKPDTLTKIKKAEKVFAFSSKTKYSGIISEGKSYVIGAPEFVLREDYAEYKDRIEAYSEKGYRVLVYGRYEGILDGQQLTEKSITDRVYHADKCDTGRSKGNLFLFYRAWCGDQGYLRG